jgi:Coenzyme PQQ synthesis protein D (PqqD)
VTIPEPAHPDQAALEGPWRRRIDTGWRATPIGLVLLPAGRRDPVTVAGSAVAVWNLLAEPITRADLADRLADRFGAPPTTVQADVGRLLARLIELEAIEPTSPSIS